MWPPRRLDLPTDYRFRRACPLSDSLFLDPSLNPIKLIDIVQGLLGVFVDLKQVRYVIISPVLGEPQFKVSQLVLGLLSLEY